MTSTQLVGPPLKKKAGDVDHLTQFLQDISEDEKLSDQLMKLRKGLPAARKQVMRNLVNSTNCTAVIEATLPMLREPSLEAVERSRLLKVLSRLLQKQPALGTASPVAPLASPLLSEAKRLLDNKDRTSSIEEGIPFLSSIVRVIGMKTFLTALRPSFESNDDHVRHTNAVAISIAAHTFGVPLTLPLVRALVRDPLFNVKQLGLTVVQQLPRHIGRSILPFLGALVSYCLDALKEPHLSSIANSALTNLADAVAPYGLEAFDDAIDILWAGARRRRGRPKIAFLRTLAALAPLTEPSMAAELASPVLEMASKLIAPADSEGNPSRVNHDIHEKRSALSVARRCMKFVGNDELKDFLHLLFAQFWTPEASEDRRTASLAVWTAVELPVSRSDLTAQLVNSNALVSDSISLQAMSIELLSKMSVSPLVLDHRTEERLMDGLLASLPNLFAPDSKTDEGLVDIEAEASSKPNETSTPSAPHLSTSVRAVKKVFDALPEDRVRVYSQTWVSVLLQMDADPSPLVRESSLRILIAISPLFSRSTLLLVLRRLFEELGEEYPEVLSEVLGALGSVISLLGASIEELSPSSSEILPRLTPILRNRNEKVQESCIKLIRSISEIAGESVSAREWMHICFELLELQKSQRQKVRYEATAAFASISTIVGPADVVATLTSHLRSPDRQFRVTTAAAIASVAAETGPFAVLPILIHEYSTGDLVMQHGILKALDFLFQFLEPGKGLPYLSSLVTLIDDALVDSNQVHRQTAASIVNHMALGSIGNGNEEIFIHFLNETMPSIFETSPHVINRVLEALESIRKVIGTSAFTNYLWAGLYHPARKVRSVYWNIWNTMYAEDADTIVPICPIEVLDPLGSGKDVRDLFA